jgi:hypothetical protein
VPSNATRPALERRNEKKQKFVTQKYDLYLDPFPDHTCWAMPIFDWPVDHLPSTWMTNRSFSIRFRGCKIGMPFPRLQSVDGTTYFAASGSNTTLDPSLYLMDEISERGIVTPAPGANWPKRSTGRTPSRSASPLAMRRRRRSRGDQDLDASARRLIAREPRRSVVAYRVSRATLQRTSTAAVHIKRPSYATKRLLVRRTRNMYDAPSRDQGTIRRIGSSRCHRLFLCTLTF